MNKQKKDEFITGGPVRADLSVYIQRGVEAEIFRAVNKEEYVAVIGPRQVGKTSLLLRIQEVVEDKFKGAAAYVDMSSINEKGVAWEVWAAELCREISRQLEQFMEVDKALKPPVSGVQWKRFFISLGERVRGSKGIWILLDEANAIPEGFGDVFYSTIRSIYTQRTARRPTEALKRLNFGFAGVFDPNRLVKDRRNSPFNVSQNFYLPDFALNETRTLLLRLKDAPEGELPNGLFDRVVERVQWWTDGHPYLTQNMGKLLEEDLAWQADASLSDQAIGKAASLLPERAGNNIRPAVTLATEKEESREVLKAVMTGTITPFFRENRVVADLELAGVIKKDETGACTIRNRTYEHALKAILDLTGEQVANQSAKKTVEVFISYSSVDKSFVETEGEIVHYLKGMERDGVVFWWDGSLETGDKWDEEIKAHIKKTDIALVLVSQFFLDSAYCQDVEVYQFLKESRERGLVIFPIILSQCNWKDYEWLQALQHIPKGEKNIEQDYASRGDRFGLYHQIRQALKEQVRKIREKKSIA